MRKRREAMGMKDIYVLGNQSETWCDTRHLRSEPFKGTVASDSKPEELKQAEVPAFYLSVLKISNWTFHSPFADFFQHTTYFPFVVVGLFCASFIFNSNVPAS